MPDAISLPTTQRAYTLRLRGVNENDRSWRDGLWATHEAVNQGAKVFGDWLLTLRGGLDHRLADEKVKSKGKPDRDPTQEERKNRRILLALSWLSVEDAHGAPRDEALIVAKGVDSTGTRERKLADALASILQAQGIADCDVGDPNKQPEDQPGTWLADCLPSLSARIRDDAVWVNRSKAFDTAGQHCSSLTRNEVWDFLDPFFANAESYLRPQRTDPDEEGEGDKAGKEEKVKDLVQKAGGWLSRRMGAGGGADFERMSRAYDAIVAWAKGAAVGDSGRTTLAALATHLSSKGFSPSTANAQGVLSVISGPGYKSATRNHIDALSDRVVVTQDDMTKLAELAAADAESSKSNIGGKGQRPYSSMIIQQVEAACGFTYLQADGPARHREFSVMLDHAARRVNVTHSWIKNAEAERRQFENDAQRLSNVPPLAQAWLRRYCEERAGSSGALDMYLIRKRAIDGWEKLVDRWSRADCQTSDDRITAARLLQDDPELDKFGDIQLFEALAAEDALCVWKPDGNPTAQPLKDFVAATEAEAKKKRFKVPAYRHPDPLRHPIFTDFGSSRWDIDFSAHRAAGKLDDMQQRVQKLEIALADAERKLGSATERQREPRQSKVMESRVKLHKAQEELAGLREAHRLNMGLWNGQTVTPVPLRWSCKRIVADLLQSSPNANGVSRADRLGRAAGNADRANAVTVTGLFEQDHWNGRLQAPRAQLDAIARYVEKHGWDARARTLIDRIRWLVTFSAQLAPQGPWTELATQLNLKPDPQYWPHAEANKKRQAHARLLLSRLPGLRVLSVDLGHRYAAACAVWEALAPEAMKTEIHGRTIIVGGCGPNDLYCHTRHTDSRGKERTTIYRRIGSDKLPDGSAHPAPWARLDRQFLIKLQGEDRAARKASPDEIKAVEQFEECVGRKRCDDEPPRDLAVDALMSDTVRTARLALARHARRAKIGYQLTATARTLPGARSQELDEAGRLELLLDTLADWHALVTDWRWSDESARQLWNNRLAALVGGFTIEPPQQPTKTQKEFPKAQRREAERELRAKLQPIAQTLAGIETLRRELHRAWCARWSADDDQWKQKLKWLSRWLMPRQLSRMIEATKQGGRPIKRREPIREAVAAASNVGGLSLTRISTLTEFRRKVQVGYFTRMWPDGGRAEIGLGFGQSTLDTLERMKDQRIKQLASRIVEAALGIGIDQDPVWDDVKKKWREHKRPHQRSSDPRFAPCHAVIIEDLSHYRPEETRTRRENRATMDWKSAETRKRLEDHCQLYGLHLRDVNPQYTSRQDSRTGAPGVRCVDVPVVDFLTKPWWRKQVARVQSKKDQNNKGDARDRYLLALEAQWSAASEEEKARAAPLRITLDGGEIFVSADPRSPLAGGIQADLNAAANIGLRALMDPDFPGRWWYVPCDPATHQPKADKVKGCILEKVGPLAEVKQADQTTAPKPKRKRSAKATKEKEVVNLWRDPAPDLLNPKPWCEYSEYLSRVKFRVIQILRARAGLPREDGT